MQGQSYVWDFVCELLIVAKYENYIEIISNEVHFFAVDWDLERIWQKAHFKKSASDPKTHYHSMCSFGLKADEPLRVKNDHLKELFAYYF